ncbi:MAG: hypothetical protein J0M24_24000 [Verrucomicrobia bacterium]|nr:hypothetical protein [Verrucomicrobiota bacterium]
MVFRSFRAGKLKRLVFAFFRRLNRSVAKILYRFLGKRFFHRPRWEFHLQELCWEHVGLARSYDAANLKRKLRPAIEELERHQFIRPASDSERFRKVSSGKWRVFFEREGRGVTKVAAPPSDTDALCQALIDRGVTRSTALETVEKFPKEQIEHQLEVFDWLLSRKDSRLLRNPAGYLVSAIRSEYVAPQEFTGRREQAEQKSRAEELERRRQARIDRERTRENQKLQARRKAVESFWSSFSQEERNQLEAECLHAANSFERSLLDKGGTLGVATREKLFEEFALKSLAVAE